MRDLNTVVKKASIYRFGLIALSTCVISLSSQSHAHANPLPGGAIGLGLVLGDPAGLSLRTELNHHNALQLHVGFDLEKFDRTRVVVALDYLFYLSNMFKSTRPHGRLSPYFGIGSALQLRELSSELKLGVRVPLGLSFRLRAAPLEFFSEIALGIHVLPETATLIDGGIGARWYF